MVSEFSKKMDLVGLGISSFLKPLGFKRRNRTFNRWTKDGLCQVFNLQMGQFEIGHPKPGIPNLYGRFTANLGIFVPELYTEMMKKETPKFINDYDCSIRARFHGLTNTTHDLWWELTSDPKSNVQELIHLLRSYGLPFFELFPDRDNIIKGLVSFNIRHSVSNRPKLDIALILDNLGKHDQAIIMFNEHYKEPHPPAHMRYLKQLAEKHKWVIH